MKVRVKESVLVKPIQETPSASLWLSNLDIVFPITHYARLVYFFRFCGAPNFFDAALLKASLSKTLVDFYPYAGRLRTDDNGRFHIDCNAEGALFIEADCVDASLDDLGAFIPMPHIARLVPHLHSSLPISTLPLLQLQLTRFKCGGASIGFATNHHTADGFASLHFLNSWSEITRGLTPASPPFLDRRLLCASNPPQPHYPHMEYQLPPSLNISLDMSHTSFKMFSLSRHQIHALQQKCRHQGNYTRYETITGHVWRSVCMARQLPHDQESSLRLPVNGRSKLRPPLPPHYFGNAIFFTTVAAPCGEIVGNPLSFAVGKVHEAVVRIDDDYMRSGLDYLELHMKKAKSVVRSVRCPNFGMTNWMRMPFYETDFGWGKPVYVGPGHDLHEEKSLVFVDPQNEDGVLFAITLLKPHMDRFQDILYHI